MARPISSVVADLVVVEISGLVALVLEHSIVLFSPRGIQSIEDFDEFLVLTVQVYEGT